MFGQGAGFGQSSAGSAFGQATGQNQQTYGTGQGPGFGTNGQSTFGSAGQTPMGFGSTTQSSSIFGTSTSTPAFGGSSVFRTTTNSSAFGVTMSTSQSTFGAGTAFGTGLINNSSAFISSQTSSGSGFGNVATSSSIFGGSGTASTLGGQTTATSLFGGTNLTILEPLGGSGQGSGSVLTSSNQTISAFSTAAPSNLAFGGTSNSQRSTTFGAASQSSSTFGGTGQGSSVFGGTGQGNSTFGGTGQGSSTFGGTSQGSSMFGGSGQGSSIFGGTGQGSSTLVATGQGNASVFGGQTTLAFGSTTGFGTVPQGQTAPGQQSKETGSTASLFGGTTTTNVFGGASKTSSGSVFGGSEGKVPTGNAASPPSNLSKQLQPPKTTFITKTTLSKGGEDCKGSGSDRTPTGTQDQAMPSHGQCLTGTNVSTGSSSSSTHLFGKTDDKNQGLFGKDRTSDTRKLGRKTSDDTDEAPRAKRTMLRRLSSVSSDISDKVVIVCRNVPAKCNNSMSLKSHFTKFGQVKRILPNPKRQQATIHFNTHEEAARAKRLGSKIDGNLNPMEIFWRRQSGSVVTSPVGQKQAEESTSRAGDSGKRRATGAEKDKPKWMKSEVDDELSSMSGTSDVNREVSGSLDRVLKRPVGQTRPARSPVTRTRQSSPTPLTPSSSTDDVNIGKDSLRTLSNSIGHTVAEKIQILKLRDKVVRHGRTKQSSLATAKAFVGHCPDMCPEMERYDRQEKRRLHQFETLQGVELQPGMNPQVDHLRAVKEYSRSSADQEEPLPYELRPISVLVTTMNYLLSEIADRGNDGTWGDWFDFLWNRMRGIRKDITQQQLCDIHTAELLEKCVRFHVFCAERLCEEDMFSFDEKINNENMTKCLQTLKELYHDLLKKHNTFCHNEAEIRAYMILMNLNQGDILRETQQLRAEVRNSVHIRFALQVYSALNSHNYVRFFRLVRDASYLNACIMHRYFTQVRGGALKRILFTCGKGDHQYAIDNLVRILAFENSSEAADFCQFYGLRANTSTVILNRSDFIQPENNWLPRRAERLIESKRLISIGEVINGAALPPLSLPSPSFSFDDNGKFMANIGISMTDMADSPCALSVKPDIDSTSPATAPPPYPGPSGSRPGIKIESALEFKPQTTIQTVPTILQAAPPQQQKFTNLDVKECAKLLFWEVIDDFCTQVSNEVSNDVQTYLDQSNAIVHSLVEEVLHQNVRALSIAYYNEVQVLRQRQLKQEREAALKRAMATLVSEVIKDVTNQELLNLATAKVREVKAELKEQQKARCSEDVGEELVEDVMGELVQSVASDVYQKDVVERLEELADIEKCIQLRIAGKFLQAWKKEFSARQKLKRGMLTFPSAPGMDSATEQIDILIPDRREDGIVGNSFSISTDGRLSLASSIQLSEQRWVGAKLLSAHELYQNLCHCKAWQPFDLVKHVGGILHRKHKGNLPTSIYWKLLLCLPDPDTCDTEGDKIATFNLNMWLRSKFSKSSKTTGQEDVLSLYKADIVQDSDSSKCKLCVCVRAIKGAQIQRNRQGVEALMGVSGIILVLPPGMDDDPDSQYWRRVHQRLDSILKLKPCKPAVSLVILCPVAGGQSMVTDNMVRQTIIDKYPSLDKVANIYILDIDYRDDLEMGFDFDSLSLSAEVEEAVQWLGEEYPNTPQLCVNYIRDFIDTTLHNLFYSPVLYNLKQRKINNCLHQRPSDLLTLYNAVISHMKEVITSPRLLDLSWPVPEFSHSNAVEGLPTSYWNDEDHLEYLGSIIQEMELPWLQDIDLENTDWCEVCDEIWAFVRSVAGDDHGSAKVDLVSKMRLLLKTIRQDFEDTCYLMEGENHCEPSFENVPWTDVITACIEYRMTSIGFTDPQIDDSEDDDQELKVVYFNDHLQAYKSPDTWTYLESQRDITGLPSLNTTVRTAVDKVHEAKLEQRRREKIQDSHITSTSFTTINLDPLSQEEMKAKEETCRLLESVKTERRESQKFDQYLQRVLNEFDTDSPDETFSRSSPLFLNSNYMALPEVLDASGIEPSVFADCVTPQRPPLSDQSRLSAFKLLDSSISKESALASVETGGVSDKLSKLKEEIKLYRRSSDILEQKLQLLIDEGL
ncbi:germinal-center associated nuclear protein-like [Ylistrum balloti]|uniref:germinal-center associated nuclear protein-like n=1 Tax=Ylistrum balloti TaxID=509963 RepID=UPI002905B0CA|nr:germinal-center associated nuclear protein-like [Ylistrum balloti]